MYNYNKIIIIVNNYTEGMSLWLTHRDPTLSSDIEYNSGNPERWLDAGSVAGDTRNDIHAVMRPSNYYYKNV